MTKERKQELKEIFLSLGPEAFTLNHYELADQTSLKNPPEWKEFLTDLEIAQWIESETAILQQTELKKLTANVASSRSVGQAQLISAMNKLQDSNTTKKGPAFVYCYIPLTEEQENADNIIKLKKDPFLTDDEE